MRDYYPNLVAPAHYFQKYHVPGSTYDQIKFGNTKTSIYKIEEFDTNVTTRDVFEKTKSGRAGRDQGIVTEGMALFNINADRFRAIDFWKSRCCGNVSKFNNLLVFLNLDFYIISWKDKENKNKMNNSLLVV